MMRVSINDVPPMQPFAQAIMHAASIWSPPPRPRVVREKKVAGAPNVEKYAKERVVILEYIRREGRGQKPELMLVSGLSNQGYRTTMESLGKALKFIERDRQKFWVIA